MYPVLGVLLALPLVLWLFPQVGTGERAEGLREGWAKGLPSRKVTSRLFCGHHDIHTEAEARKKK